MSKLTYSQLREQKRVDLVKDSPLPMPLSMYIDPSSLCNFSCIYCPQSDTNSKDFNFTTMKLDDFKKIVADIKSLGRLKTCNLFSFGEPLLNPLTPQFLQIAKENDIAEKYVITSNVSLLTEEKARQLVDNELSFLRVSIYGAYDHSYQERTNTKIRLEHIKKNLAYLKAYRDSVQSSLSIAVKMLDTNIEEENQFFLETFSALGDECFIEPLHNWHNEEQKFNQLKGNKEKSKCPYPFYTLVVHADLDVSVCCPDWNKKLCIGNLKEQSLEEIWKSEQLFSIQCALLAKEMTKNTVCETCSFYEFSAGDNIDALSLEEYKKRHRA